MASLVPSQAIARVLLIDDEEVDYVLTRKQLDQLEDRCYELDWADTFDGGLRALQHGRYDVCLVDYRLGERTGLELLSVCASLGISIPMILMTGGGDEELDSLPPGGSALLDKRRADAPELGRVLRYVLHREGLVADLLDHNEELVRLHRLTQIFLLRRPLSAALDAAAREIACGSGFPIVTIELYEASRDAVRCVAACGLEGAVSACERPLLAGPSARVLRTRKPLVEVVHAAGLAVRTLVCAPMLAEAVDGSEPTEHLVGVLSLAHPEPLPVDSVQLHRATTLASHLAALYVGLEGAVLPRAGGRA